MNKFEDILKEKLEHHEMPYTDGAWESFSAKAGGAAASPKKWYWFAGAASIIAVTSIFLFTNNTEDKNTTATKTTITVSPDVKNNEVKQELAKQVKTNNAINSKTNKSLIDTENKIAQKKTPEIPVINKTPQTIATNPTLELKDNEELVEIDKPIKEEEITQELPQTEKYGVGTLSTNTICKGERFTILNNTNGKVKFLLAGVITELTAGKEFVASAKENLKIEFIDANNALIAEEFVQVTEPNTEEFDLDFNEDNGVQFIEINTGHFPGKVHWTRNGKSIDVSETQYAFTEGTETFEMTTTDLNGCSNTIKHTIDVAKNYNLFAPTSMSLSAPRNGDRVFIPQALNYRNLQFKMTIFDRDGSIVYTTNDPTTPWDGRNIRNGKYCKTNQAYIWQVVIDNPLPGENNIYKGTVTLID